MPMLSFDNNLVQAERLSKPIQCIDVAFGRREHKLSEIFTEADLQANLSDNELQGPGCRIISLCQKFSYSPLQATKRMMDMLVDRYDIPQIHDMASCFYHRGNDVEEGFCMPLRWLETKSRLEISYSIRYPESKPGQANPWAMRQTGVCHMFDWKKRQSLIVLFHPKPSSRLQTGMVEFLQSPGNDMIENPLWIHNLLVETYLPQWRSYIAFQENEVLPIGRKAVDSYVVGELNVEFGNLAMLYQVNHRLLQAPAVLTHICETIDYLLRNLTNTRHREAGVGMEASIEQTNMRLHNSFQQVRAYCRTAQYLQQRTQSTAQLVADKLALQDQLLAKKQNDTMLRLNRSVVVITTVTLFYLPASFLAAFFGMDFFDIKAEQGGNMAVASVIWVYFVATFVLTAITISVYYWVYGKGGTALRASWERRRQQLLLKSKQMETEASSPDDIPMMPRSERPSLGK